MNCVVAIPEEVDDDPYFRDTSVIRANIEGGTVEVHACLNTAEYSDKGWRKSVDPYRVVLLALSIPRRRNFALGAKVIVMAPEAELVKII